MQNETLTRFSNILNKFINKKVAVFGDLMLDRYINGTVRRISPEAPVPVVKVTSERSVCGGAANVAVNLSALGANPTMISVCGCDKTGETLREILHTHKVSTDKIVQDESFFTIEKTRVIAEHQQVVRFDKEVPEKLSAQAKTQALKKLDLALKEGCEGVILSDYGKGLLEPVTIKKAIQIAHKRNVPVFVDPKVEHFIHYRGVSCLTPNTMEAFGGMRIPVQTGQEAAEKLGIKIMAKLGSDSLMITQGENGLTLFNRIGGKKIAISHIPTRAREVFDVTGAGDTVISTFALARVSGASPEEAAAISNFAAGVVVAKLGTATATHEEILENIKKWLKIA